MSLLYKRLTVGVAIVGTAILAFGVACFAAGARINTTKSIPVGLYWTSEQPVAKSAYVLFCPPHANEFTVARERGYICAGFCPANHIYDLYPVIAGGNGSPVTVSFHVPEGEQIIMSTDKGDKARVLPANTRET